MSKYLSFCKQNNAKTRRTSKKKVCINWNCYNRILFLVVCICLVGGYVFLTNFGITKGFEIAELEDQVNILQEQNRNLANEVQTMKSLGIVEERAKEMDLVSVNKVEYLSVGSGFAIAK
ncbi:MAG: hypothetical protein ABIA91_01485 [Patescibacteria group bacterium]